MASDECWAVLQTDHFREQLERVAEYKLAISSGVLKSFLDNLDATIECLRILPRMGRTCEWDGLRFTTCPDYIVRYELNEATYTVILCDLPHKRSNWRSSSANSCEEAFD